MASRDCPAGEGVPRFFDEKSKAKQQKLKFWSSDISCLAIGPSMAPWMVFACIAGMAAAAVASAVKPTKPHIIFLMPDDLGYNNVPWNPEASVTFLIVHRAHAVSQ
jgi:hypothetical protein